MQFSEIIGQEQIKNYLIKSTESGRIPHAQLFVGKEGTGTLAMALAYSQYILCRTTKSKNTDRNEACTIKCNALSHPDLHFVYPVNTNDDIKSHPLSSLFLQKWRTFVSHNAYGSLMDWYKHIGLEKKQGNINVEEASEILKSLSLKAYEGGYKIMIIWMADKMNTASANKILKILEEPLPKTVFILISENEENILQTIRSRCQVLYFNTLHEEVLANALVAQHQATREQALKIAYQSQGNYNKALHLFRQEKDDFPYEEWFVSWVRTAFRAKGNAEAIHGLILWSENIASQGREVQKKFLLFCIDVFRQALLLHYKTTDLVYMSIEVDTFKIENFAPFVNGNNIHDIFKELSDAIYHIERNGNAKIILTDLSIKLTRLIHKKSESLS